MYKKGNIVTDSMMSYPGGGLFILETNLTDDRVLSRSYSIHADIFHKRKTDKIYTNIFCEEDDNEE
jgi:hypothetical protein